MNHQWHDLANDPLLWKRFCHMPQWRFSRSTEVAQIEKYKTPSQAIDVRIEMPLR